MISCNDLMYIIFEGYNSIYRLQPYLILTVWLNGNYFVTLCDSCGLQECDHDQGAILLKFYCFFVNTVLQII